VEQTPFRSECASDLWFYPEKRVPLVVGQRREASRWDCPGKCQDDDSAAKVRLPDVAGSKDTAPISVEIDFDNVDIQPDHAFVPLEEPGKSQNPADHLWHNLFTVGDGVPVMIDHYPPGAGAGMTALATDAAAPLVEPSCKT
jgi:hypothetical protein